jgi:thioredoxin-like negative regulator of GroEL
VLLAALAWLTSSAGPVLLRHAGLPVRAAARLIHGLADLIGATDTDELLRDAESVAAEIADEYDRGLALTVLAFVHAQAGKPADALQILADVQELARGRADNPYRKALLLIFTAWVGQAGARPVDDLVREVGGRLRILRESMRSRR